MAIEEKTRIERLLIVFNDDGTVKAAHQQKLTSVTGTSIPIPDVQGDAEPVTPDAVVTLFPDRASLLTQVQGLLDNVAALTELRIRLETSVTNLTDELAKTAAERDQAVEGWKAAAAERDAALDAVKE